MKRAIIALACAAALALTGCYKPAESSSAAGIEFKVDRLFKHDGCTVYRFYDVSTRYFVKCEGAATSTMQWSETCGKNCTQDFEVVTGYAVAPDQRPKR